MDQQITSQFFQLVQRSSDILLMTHKKIDGDGLTSTLALYRLLQKLGKNVTAVCEEPVPEVFRFLPITNVLSSFQGEMKEYVVSIAAGENEIQNVRYEIESNKINFIVSSTTNITQNHIAITQQAKKCDLIIVLDTPEFSYLGSLYEKNIETFFDTPVVSIDHHVNNTYFGKMNIVDITASSTSEIIFSLFNGAEYQNFIDEDVATLLLAGIITDTASFQNANTTPRAFFAASSLVHFGARQQEIIKNIYKTKQLSTLKLWGEILANVQHEPIYRIVWSYIDHEAFSKTKSSSDELYNLMQNLLGNAPGAEIIFLLAETEAGHITGFLKANNPTLELSAFDKLLNIKIDKDDGRFEIQGTLSEAQKRIISELQDFQTKRLGISPQDLEQIALKNPQVSFSSPKNIEKDINKEVITIDEITQKVSDESMNDKKDQ